MTTQLHPIMAAALRTFAPPQSEVHKIEEVDPKLKQSWDRAIKLEQELPESLRGNHL